jgi:predicted ribosome quality control (RQC) complex YloA/Tae2 family protein
MHVDFLTLACLKHDLERLEGARIQQVVMTNEQTLALELYAGFRAYLLLDISPQHSRALLQEEKARRGVERETPLGLLLKKYVRGGRLRAVEQPAWERILRFHVEHEEGRSVLVAEIMGKYSNLLLLDEAGTIRECVRRVGPEQNPYRVTLPNHPYVSPPPLTKRPPPMLGEQDWERLLASADAEQPLHRLLVRELAAVSPTLAREMVARASGEADTPVGEVEALALLDAASDLFAPLQSGQWEPHLARDEEGEVIAFAPYELTQFEESEPAATISEAMQRFFEARMDTDAYAAARRRVAEMLAQARKSVEGTLYQLRSQHVDPAEVERLRESGELLLAYQWQVQKGSDSVELFDYEGEPRRIALDPTQTPVENAQRYFTRYEKKKRAAEEVPPRVEAAEADLSFLQGLENDLQQAEERPEIDAVRVALVSAGLVHAPKRRRGGTMPVRGPRRVVLGQWTILVGRNSQQNDEVTFRYGAPEDLWFHARGVPGSHVILKTAGREPSPEIVERAAALAAYYSQARGNREADVVVTERRHVRRISGARPGLVTYRSERTLRVSPMSAEEAGEEEETEA